jgi:fatty acid desaturase
MAIFRYRADRSRVAVFLAYFAVDIAVYLTVENLAILVLYFVVGIIPKGTICAFNHHHQHVATFKVTALNRLLEIVYALQTGVSSHAWVLHHSVGHHLHYLDQSKDESRWMRNDKLMGKLQYTVVTALTAYPRAWQVGAQYKKFRRTFLWMGLTTLAVVVALVAYRPIPGLMVFVLAPLFSLFGTVYATYTHHSDRSTESHFVASTNVLQPLYNKMTGNLGFHTAHHYRPGVHWSKLSEVHERIADRIPEDAYVSAGFPYNMVRPKLVLPTITMPKTPAFIQNVQAATESMAESLAPDTVS